MSFQKQSCVVLDVQVLVIETNTDILDQIHIGYTNNRTWTDRVNVVLGWKEIQAFDSSIQQI